MIYKSDNCHRCALNGDLAYDLDDIRDKRSKDSEYSPDEFYIGQQLWGPMCSFESARWLHLTKEMSAARKKENKKVYAVVEEVCIGEIGDNGLKFKNKEIEVLNQV